MTRKRVESIIAEHGYSQLEYLVALEFSRYTGMDEIKVRAVLNTQYVECLGKLSGRGKQERATEQACMLLISGFEDYHGQTNTKHYRPETVAEFMAMRFHAYVFGALVALGVKMPKKENG